MIQGIIILNNADYVPQPYHGTLLSWAVIVVAVFINTVVSALLPIIEGLVLVVHILGFFAVLIPLVYISPHGSAASVFQTVLNEGNWPTQGLSYCVGFIGNVATFVGEQIFANAWLLDYTKRLYLQVPTRLFTSVLENIVYGRIYRLPSIDVRGN